MKTLNPGAILNGLIAALLVGLLPLSEAQAEIPGRLFFTPQQRLHLDYNYARNAPANGNGAPVITVNGIVQKNGGARTVWVNGVSQSGGYNQERNPIAQTVTVPGKAKSVKLKVGDKILLDEPAAPVQSAPAE